MDNRLLPLLATLGLALLASFDCRGVAAEEPEQSARPSPTKLPDRVDEVLRWLPVDTQTFIVDQGPATILSSFGRGQDADGLFIGSWPPSLAKEAGRRLAGVAVKFLVEGSRRFRGPDGLGLMPYEGAMIVGFEQDLNGELSKSLHEGATQTETIAGRRVSKFQVRYERDDWTIYVTQPMPNVLISATHRGYLVDLLGRMDHQGASRALPEGLPEWKNLELTARVWGMRHYDAKDAERDPTSPLGPWGVRDDQAVGFVFAYDPQKDETIVRHLSRSKDATSAYSKFWQLKTRPAVREVGLGLVEFSATIKPGQFGPGEADMLFRLSVALGHGLCL